MKRFIQARIINGYLYNEKCHPIVYLLLAKGKEIFSVEILWLKP